MDTNDPDGDLESLPDRALRERLARQNWNDDSEFVPDEQVFRLLRRARMASKLERVGLLGDTLSRRMIVRGKKFAVRSGIFPANIDDLNRAGEEIALYVWECLFERPGDAAHAEKFFGQLFKRRALDFQRRLLAKKRKCQASLDAMAHVPEDEDPEKTVREVIGLQQHETPSHVLDTQQRHAQAAARLQAILTKNEHSTYVMLFVDEMQVQEVAAALGTSVRTINTYKNAALEKVKKEFQS